MLALPVLYVYIHALYEVEGSRTISGTSCKASAQCRWTSVNLKVQVKNYFTNIETVTEPILKGFLPVCHLPVSPSAGSCLSNKVHH